MIVTQRMADDERRKHSGKTKRGGVILNTPDTLRLIDRLVDNLDADELNYLQERMGEAESRLVGEGWRESLDATLEERETGRRRLEGR